MARPLRLLARRVAPIVVTLALCLGAVAGASRARAQADPAEACAILPTEPLPFPGPFAQPPAPSQLADSTPGSQVSVERDDTGYHLLVNGTPGVLRGMGYNPRYAGLPLAERAARYQRDFSQMAAAGVNTVLGWNPAEFDGLTLDAAQQAGLGVVMPYDLDWRLDLSDPAVRSALQADILSWVERYRGHPAVRMWGIGNETLHKLVPPVWCSQAPESEQAQRARDLAAFLAETVDAVHALDPDHPVIYRESEDSYVEWMRDALAWGGPRPWLVYGLNLYTPRIVSVLDEWPSRGFDTPLLISEFAPGPESRPGGYRDFWSVIRGHANIVLGGAVYVWFAEGPEAIDRVYGLIGPDDQPVDGSLQVIQDAYQNTP
jgi:beta-galactosidase/beta-glucuronidase